MKTPTTVQDRARAFVAEAERMTNERDIDGIGPVFASDARWTTTIDGTVISADGQEDIQRAWAAMCRFMAARRMFVTKSLVTADETTIVNEWTGEVAGRRNARGIEVWQFDEDGLVADQRLYGFLDARSEGSVRQNLRMLTTHPLTALAFLRTRPNQQPRCKPL